MKPLLHNNSRNYRESFSSKTEMGLGIDQQRHYHLEHEILYIVKGCGTLVIADTVTNFQDGDVFFIGSGLPHMMRLEKSSVIDIPDCEVSVIHFLPEILKYFADMPENKLIADLFSRGAGGVIIKGGNRGELKDLTASLTRARNTERIIILLKILSIMAEYDHEKVNSKITFKSSANNSNDNRLNKIYHYTFNNFSKSITVQEVANIINMCANSFCRYFKSKTHKRYSAFLMEIRINHACKLLSETAYSVSVVSLESGYMNLSNFNRHFKHVKGKTPLEYRKQFHSNQL